MILGVSPPVQANQFLEWVAVAVDEAKPQQGHGLRHNDIA